MDRAEFSHRVHRTEPKLVMKLGITHTGLILGISLSSSCFGRTRKEDATLTQSKRGRRCNEVTQKEGLNLFAGPIDRRQLLSKRNGRGKVFYDNGRLKVNRVPF